MREIKCRAWDKIKEEMIYSAIELELRGLELNGDETKDLNSIPIGFGEDFYGQRFDFMLYTGEKDSKDVEIYEGDELLSIEDFGSEEYPDPREVRETVEYKGGAFYPVCEMPSRSFTVIGNIFEGVEEDLENKTEEEE